MEKNPSNTEKHSIQGTTAVNFPNTDGCQASNGPRVSVTPTGDLGSSVKEQHGHTGERLAKGHKDNEGMGAPHIRGKSQENSQENKKLRRGNY